MTTLHRCLFVAFVFSCQLSAGTIIGVFSNPVLAGSVANDPSVGNSTYLDNTGTAVYYIDNVNDPDVGGTPPQQQYGNFILWGSGDASELDFFGAEIPADPSTPFQIGTFTFTNGTSNLDQLIFGFTVSFYDTVVGTGSFLGSDQVVITTTQDIAGGAPGDDDYVNICGTFSSICNQSIESVETSEGGDNVTVDLTGSIIGDPTLMITGVSLAAGQNGTSNGFIGTDAPIGAETPEPATWTMLLGAAALALWAKSRKSKPRPQSYF